MIVRILGESQYTIDDTDRPALEALDSTVAHAVDTGDAHAFPPALEALIEAVRRVGTPLADDDFSPSDLVVPFADATLEETRGLLAQAEDASGSDDR